MSIERGIEPLGRMREQYTALEISTIDVDSPEWWRRLNQLHRAQELVENYALRLLREEREIAQ